MKPERKPILKSNVGYQFISDTQSNEFRRRRSKYNPNFYTMKIFRFNNMLWKQKNENECFSTHSFILILTSFISDQPSNNIYKN